MLLTELILSKKGPLSKVWISAHQERKLNKTQTLQVDVPESVEAILDQDGEPIALRMSGQLMLGVVRIYSKQAQYLFDDAKDVRDKISNAFRPGAVDLPADQLTATRNAITIHDGGREIDLVTANFNAALDWDELARTFANTGAHVANAADITLPRARYASSMRSASIVRDSSDSGLDSQEYLNGSIDLGLDMGDDTIEVEFGRREERSARASSVASSGRRRREESILSGSGIRSLREGSVGKDGAGNVSLLDGFGGDDVGGHRIGLGRRGRDMSLTPVPMDIDIGPEPLDLGLDLGDGFGGFGDVDDQDVQPIPMDVDLPALEPDADPDAAEAQADALSRARRESTRLTTPPAEDESSTRDSFLAEMMDSQTAGRIAELTAQREVAAANRERAQQEEGAGRRKKRVRIAEIDEEIELDEGEVGRRDVSDILGKPNFIPSSKALLAYERIQEDPMSFYAPTINRNGQLYYLPPLLDGFPDEINELLMFPATRVRSAAADADERQRKRARTAEPEEEEEEQEELEVGRRDELAGRASERAGPSSVRGGDDLDGDDAGFGGFGGDDTGMDLDVGGIDLPGDDDLGLGHRQSSVPASERPSRAGSVARSIIEARAEVSGLSEECPIAFFDTRLRLDGLPQSQSQSSQSQTRSLYGVGQESIEDYRGATGKGWSRNTVMAVEYLRQELREEEGELPGEKKLSFGKAAAQGSKRAASTLFFELLVLGTRDMVKLEQESAYADIKVKSKPKLFEGSAETRPEGESAATSEVAA